MTAKVSKRQRSIVRDTKAHAVRRAAIQAIPTTWLDELLTGPNGIGAGPYNGQHIERLLSAVKRRVEHYTRCELDGVPTASNPGGRGR